MNEVHSCPIRGVERQFLKNDFKKGIKPLKKYIDVFAELQIIIA